jgi:hypothetical protein
MKEALVTLAGVMITWGILVLFYGAVRTEWPENYAGVSSDFGTIVNRTGVRYLIYRTAPAYLVALLVSTMASRVGGNGVIAVLAGAGIYTCLTQCRHMVDVWRHRHGRRLPAMLVSATSAIGI